LIRDGAKLVEHPSDILEELPPWHLGTIVNTHNSDASGSQDGDEQAACVNSRSELLGLIDHEGCLIQSLMAATGMDFPGLNQELLAVELKGKIVIRGSRCLRAE